MTVVAIDPALAKTWETADDIKIERCGSCGQPKEEPIVTACMTMVLRVFEKLGHRIVRSDRSYFKVLDGRPFEIAHTIFPLTDTNHVEAALRGAWDHLYPLLLIYAPEMRSSKELKGALDRVVLEAIAERRCVTLLDVRTALRPFVLG